MVTKYSIIMPSILFWSSCHALSKFCSPTILFFQRLWLAMAWKNFIFQSPHLIQSTLDLWFHMISSLVTVSLISIFKFRISSAFLWVHLVDSNYWSLLCFCLRTLFTFPNTFQFYLFNCSWQLFNLFMILSSRSPQSGSHAASTTFLHPSSLVHIASNKKCFFNDFLS